MINRKNLEKLLDDLGIGIHLKGYWYWIELVELKEKYKSTPIGILLEEIALRHNVLKNNVANTLKYTYSNRREDIQKYFGVGIKIYLSTLLLLILRELGRMKE